MLTDLSQHPADITFPDPRKALAVPNGLLAIGGDLTPKRLQNAYYQGIFPWFNRGDPILWWSPDPRCIIDPILPRLPRSLKKTIRQRPFDITVDHAFTDVVSACAEPTPDRPETWITTDIRQAYQRLHLQDIAHSIECWQDGSLVGGLYGVVIGQVFCGESMFSRVSNASKVAFMMLCYALSQAGFQMIDGQLPNDYLHQLGGRDVPRENFLNALHALRDAVPKYDVWENRHFNIDLLIEAI